MSSPKLATPHEAGAPLNTPGRVLEFLSAPIFPNSPINIFTVPIGGAFYIDFLMFAAFTPPPEGTAIYFAVDGIPILGLTHDTTSQIITFGREVRCRYTAVAGPLGPAWSSPISILVTYGGTVHF